MDISTCKCGTRTLNLPVHQEICPVLLNERIAELEKIVADKKVISVKVRTQYDEDGEELSWDGAILIDGHMGFGSVDPIENEQVAVRFCGAEFICDGVEDAVDKITRHPLVMLGNFEVQG
jgi:hypothetical protein